MTLHRTNRRGHGRSRTQSGRGRLDAVEKAHGSQRPAVGYPWRCVAPPRCADRPRCAHPPWCADPPRCAHWPWCADPAVRPLAAVRRPAVVRRLGKTPNAGARRGVESWLSRLLTPLKWLRRKFLEVFNALVSEHGIVCANCAVLAATMLAKRLPGPLRWLAELFIAGMKGDRGFGFWWLVVTLGVALGVGALRALGLASGRSHRFDRGRHLDVGTACTYQRRRPGSCEPGRRPGSRERLPSWWQRRTRTSPGWRSLIAATLRAGSPLRWGARPAPAFIPIGPGLV